MKSTDPKKLVDRFMKPFHTPISAMTKPTTTTPERVVLTTMDVYLEGGSQHGQTRTLDTRDCVKLTLGLHRPSFTITDTYKRTIDIHHSTGRTIFRHVEQQLFKLRPPTFLEKLVAWTGFHKPTINL